MIRRTKCYGGSCHALENTTARWDTISLRDCMDQLFYSLHCARLGQTVSSPLLSTSSLDLPQNASRFRSCQCT